MAPLKLHYFAFPGRAEIARMCLTVGNVPFEEVTYDFKTWPEHKAKMPFGQMPVLELPSGELLAQSGAIERYVAKLAGLYPADPLQAAYADQAAFQMSDVFELFNPTWKMPAEAGAKAQQEILAGKAKEKLLQLSKLIEACPSGYVAGESLSYADVALYVTLSNLVCGFMGGVPPTLLDEYPVLKAYRNKIASLPAIKEYYDKHGEGLRAAFKPDAK